MPLVPVTAVYVACSPSCLCSWPDTTCTPPHQDIIVIALVDKKDYILDTIFKCITQLTVLPSSPMCGMHIPLHPTPIPSAPPCTHPFQPL